MLFRGNNIRPPINASKAFYNRPACLRHCHPGFNYGVVQLNKVKTVLQQTHQSNLSLNETNLTNPRNSITTSPIMSPRIVSFKSIILLISPLLLQFSLINAHGGSDDAANDDHADLHEKGLILVKVWCLIILLVTTFAGGVSPYFYRWNESFLLLGTQFAGGVFLGTSMMHFLSDSNETFGDLTSKGYPFAFMLASAGYLLTMLGDCIISFVAKGSSEKEARVEEEGRTVSDHKEDVNPVFIGTTSFGDTILLILALCFHSVFEGIAVGVAGTSRTAEFSNTNFPIN